VFFTYKTIRVYKKYEFPQTLMMSCNAKLEEGPTNPPPNNPMYCKQDCHVVRGCEVTPVKSPEHIMDAAIVALLMSPSTIFIVRLLIILITIKVLLIIIFEVFMLKTAFAGDLVITSEMKRLF